MRLIVVLALLLPLPVLAEAGDWIVRAGPALVDPHDSSDPIDVAGLATLPGATVKDNTQLGLTFTYMLSDTLGVELLAATPFTHDIYVKGVGIKAGDTKHLPPTLSLQYHFMTGGAFRPYLGAGINTTIFFDEDVDPALNSALDGIVGLPAGTVQAGLSLDQSWGLTLQAGFDYDLNNDGWLINGSIWLADIDTEATISTAVADVKFDVDIDPVVFMLSIGRRF